MTSQWSSFANYRVGDQVQNGSSVVYGCILANTNEPPPNATYWNVLAPPSGGGITSLQALTSADNGGNIVFSSQEIAFTTDPPTGKIIMTVPPVPFQYYYVVPTAQETEIVIDIPGMTPNGKVLAQWFDSNIMVLSVVSGVLYEADKITVFPSAYPVLPSPTEQFFDTTSRITVLVLTLDDNPAPP
jgi:hypothetical protein